MSFKFLAGSGQPVYNTRSGTYIPDANGIITVTSPASTDITDLLAAGCISLGALQALNNFSATSDPGVTSDSAHGYAAGSRWINTSTGVEWNCISAGVGVAVWVPLVSTGMLLGRIIGANMNAVTDQPFVMTNWAGLNHFRITKITVKNASISLDTAVGGVYPAASKAGTAIVANTQVYSSLTAAAKALDLTLAVGTTVYAAGGAPIFALTTAQGAAATADLYLFGDIYV